MALALCSCSAQVPESDARDTAGREQPVLEVTDTALSEDAVESGASEGARADEGARESKGAREDEGARTGERAQASGGAQGNYASGSAESASSRSGAVSTPSYPTAWAITDDAGIPAGVAVQLLSVPGFNIEPHGEGWSLSPEDLQREKEGWPADLNEGSALVQYEGELLVVDPDLLLVNLPDVLPDAVYDVVYSYAATSNCAGIAIPGVTGERIEGYVQGKQESDYWAKPEYVVPCAYRTALKAVEVCKALQGDGYRLLVYDAYRPMTAQYYLSDKFALAYENDQAIRDNIGDWSLDWYVASGASGHNYGTDLDVGVCDSDGNPIAMPSSFDAFDESGHLTVSPLASGDISPASYRDAVLGNDACMALHDAFVAAGFSELASEWWHFGDSETEATNAAVVGPDGLDFVATL